MRLIRSDGRGVFILCGGTRFRPGNVTGYDHAYDQSDGGLVEGDKVKATHLSGTPLMRITMPTGIRHHWCDEYLIDQEVAKEKYRQENPGEIAAARAALDSFLRPVKMVRKGG